MSEPPRAEADCRCLCGSLLARRVERGVELKCRRCKRTLILPLSDVRRPARAGDGWTPLQEARQAP
jgi:hypothetical protein